jgi:hypothetical protein
MDEPHVNDCGCCAGIDTETPALIKNATGLPMISYRTGDYPKFRESLLAKLSSSEYPALARLSSREQGDFTIALCDATAAMLDVLTFYQERIANENYLRTATERGSLIELARLIGYTPLPGVAASTYLAFTLQESPGAPAQAAEPVTIPVGTRVQSVPGPDEQAQTFETVEAIKARVEWNAIPVQTTIPWMPKVGDTDLWLEGLANQIQPGDVLLIVDAERDQKNSGSVQWDIRLLKEIEFEKDNNRTRVVWENPLGTNLRLLQSGTANTEVYVFRQRAGLFGHNAPDPKLMITKDNPNLSSLLHYKSTGSYPFIIFELTTPYSWANYEINEMQIDIDSVYPKITPGSWFVLVANKNGLAHTSGFAGDIELYLASQVAFPSRTDFGLSGKITRLIPDRKVNPDKYTIPDTLVLAQSELLPIAPRPLLYPLYGDSVALASFYPELTPNRKVAIYGKRQRITILFEESLTLENGTQVTLKAGDSLKLCAAPERGTGGVLTPEMFGNELSTSNQLVLKVQKRDGQVGTMSVAANHLRFENAYKDDPEVSELVVIDSILGSISSDQDRSTLKLKSSMRNCYERATVRINANVTQATHGETVNEILGSGDSRLRNANFLLKQSPLTYVSAATPSGRQSTLKLRVNDLEWKEKPTLFQQGPSDRVYTTLTDAEAHTTVRFGDGREGGLLPSGDHNIRAVYRKGLGLAGNVPAGKLTTLLTRPLGVSGVSNPEPANGGADSEKLEAVRTNAPMTVKTLDRVVSIQDYRDFACTFAGIAKAHALKINIGPARGIFLTVASENGVPFPESSDTLFKLIKALRDFGDPLMPIRAVDYSHASFRLSARVKLSAEADPDIVLPEIKRALRETFGFERAEFGKGVALDYVLAVIQKIEGVEAGFLDEFYRLDAPPSANASKVIPRLAAAIPVASYKCIPSGAELLTLDSGSITLEVMA